MKSDSLKSTEATLKNITAETTTSAVVKTDSLVTAKITTDSITVAKATAAAVSIGGAVNLASEKLAVVGNTGIYGDFNVTGNIKTARSLTFAQNKTITYTALNSNTGFYSYGKIPDFSQMHTCSFPAISANDSHWFEGSVNAWGPLGWSSGNACGILSMGYDGANGKIDISGPNNAKLLINYYCGRDVVVGGGGLDDPNNPLPTTGNLEARYNAYFATHSGNVGIGTTTPGAKLDVNGSVKFSNIPEYLDAGELLVMNNDENIGTMRIQDAFSNFCNISCINGNIGIGSNIPENLLTSRLTVKVDELCLSALNLLNSEGNSLFYVANNGKVGVGTSNPYVNFEVHGDFLIARSSSPQYPGFDAAYIKGGDEDEYGSSPLDPSYSWYRDQKTGIFHPSQNIIAFSTNGQEVFRADGSNVIIKNQLLINTTTPDPTAKLTVRGKIKASEIDIIEIDDIPDYVFEKDYSLMNLKDLEEYVSKNKHLPDMPSAKLIKDNGMPLGKMNTLLLKKVEELTLYIIELKKQNDELQQKFEDFEKTLKP
jgi:hypothetical protein